MLNRYAYARNNPLKYNDPNGHFINCVVGGFVGCIIGGIVGGAVALAMDTDINAGIIGGAISGAFVGSGASLIGGALKAGATAPGAIKAMTAWGGMSGVLGNTASQVTANMNKGQDMNQALGNVDMAQQALSGMIGAMTAGFLTGVSSVTGNSFKNALQQQNKALGKTLPRQNLTLGNETAPSTSNTALNQSNTMKEMIGIENQIQNVTKSLRVIDNVAIPAIEGGVTVGAGSLIDYAEEEE